MICIFITDLTLLFFIFRLKDALKTANIKSSSNDLETFFKIIVRMGKESPMGLDLDNAYANLFEINNDRMKTSKIKYWKDKASRIKSLFEELGHTNIIELMKGVIFYPIYIYIVQY